MQRQTNKTNIFTEITCGRETKRQSNNDPTSIILAREIRDVAWCLIELRLTTLCLHMLGHTMYKTILLRLQDVQFDCGRPPENINQSGDLTFREHEKQMKRQTYILTMTVC